MTKEELLIALGGSDKYFHLVDEFFSQNICIPRGENRHPDADVLHELIENSQLTLEIDVNSKLSNGMYPYTLRIKPPEPVYEWQWYFIQRDGTAFVEHKFYADGELSTDREWHKIEETKRERK